jgi:hypothetical protein
MPYPEPPDSDHEITYKFTDLVTYALIAELPVNNCQFSLVVDGSGPFQCTLDVEDPNVNSANWIAATAVNKSAMWVDIDGTLYYGGLVTGRTYTMSKQQVELTGSDFYGYMSRRLQAADYANYTDPMGYQWATAGYGAPAAVIAYYVMIQALAEQYSIPIDVAAVPTSQLPGSADWITFTAPLTQQQTVDAIVTQLQGLGFGVGIDFAQDVSYIGGNPVPTLTLSYPRRGLAAGLTGMVLDVGQAIDFVYEQDGTQQSDGVVEQTGASGAVATESQWGPAMSQQGYPLFESAISHASMSPTSTPQSVLNAFIAGDLAMLAYPFTTPVVTVPAFDGPIALTDSNFSMGNDVLLYVPAASGQGITNVPLFPSGLAYYYRMMRADITIADEGVSTMDITMNIPPNTIPQVPPVF